ncbi:MAG: glycoside hydrolase family 15 protein [Bdellovibrionota bacterium]
MHTPILTMLAILLAVFPAVAGRSFVSPSPLETWLLVQESKSTEKLLANVSPRDSKPGVVIASPERVTPNYYFHWIRDAALTMDVVIDLHDRAFGPERAALRAKLVDYLRFSRLNQVTTARTGMGEPKFNVDGTAFNGDWCRPQNDGPALRAVTLIRFAERLLSSGDAGLVRAEMYDGKIPTHTVIKADLEFVAHHWREKSCDIWEEVEGDHLYTRLAQHRALTDGARLASRLGDHGAARFYRAQARALHKGLASHWNATKRLLIPTLNRSGGLEGKSSDVDSQVILGILHGSGIELTDARVRSTLDIQTRTFAALYSINKRPGIAGVGIGRYPEDVYDGDRFEGGNPWVLSTAAFATAHYLLAASELEKGDALAARLELAAGDQFLERLRFHANPDGSLSEQFQRDTGYMTSARDLTWSHAEVLRAIWAREDL